MKIKMNRNLKVPLTGKEESIEQASNSASGRQSFKVPQVDSNYYL
jgi:hypothetical protein